jgi:hypothetical protein
MPTSYHLTIKITFDVPVSCAIEAPVPKRETELQEQNPSRV